MMISGISPKFQGLAFYITPSQNSLRASAFSSKGAGIGRDEVKITVTEFSDDIFGEHSRTFRVGASPIVGELADRLDNADLDVNGPELRKLLAHSVENAMLFALPNSELRGQGVFKGMDAFKAMDWVESHKSKLVQQLRSEPLHHEVNAWIRGPKGERLLGVFENGQLIRAMRESRFYENQKTYPLIYVDPARNPYMPIRNERRSALGQWWRHRTTSMPEIRVMPEAMKSWQREEVRSAVVSLEERRPGAGNAS